MCAWVHAARLLHKGADCTTSVRGVVRVIGVDASRVRGLAGRTHRRLVPICAKVWPDALGLWSKPRRRPARLKHCLQGATRIESRRMVSWLSLGGWWLAAPTGADKNTSAQPAWPTPKRPRHGNVARCPKESCDPRTLSCPHSPRRPLLKCVDERELLRAQTQTADTHADEAAVVADVDVGTHGDFAHSQIGK